MGQMRTIDLTFQVLFVLFILILIVFFIYWVTLDMWLESVVLLFLGVLLVILDLELIDHLHLYFK